jgi:hypothetical protein
MNGIMELQVKWHRGEKSLRLVENLEVVMNGIGRVVQLEEERRIERWCLRRSGVEKRDVMLVG